MAEARDIEFLPAGWRWVAAGKEKWITSEGKESTARHARRGNQTLSTRQVQNIQRAERSALNIPKAPAIRRTGRIRTVKGSGPRGRKLQTNVTTGFNQNTGVGSIYNEEVHGYTETYVFYTFDDAQEYALTHNPPDFAAYMLVQIRYTNRLVATDRVGSDEVGKGPGYATLSRGFLSTSKNSLTWGNGVNATETPSGDSSPWEYMREHIGNYDMSGQDARVYFYLMEK